MVQKSDLILGLGYDPIEMRPGWRNVWDPRVHRMIDITPEANTHYMHHDSLALISALNPTLAALTSGAGKTATWPCGAPSAAQAALIAAFPHGMTGARPV